MGKLKSGCMAALTMLLGIGSASAAKTDVKEIHPPHWWVGMNHNSLQLQIYGTDIRDADFSVNYPGVSVDSVVRLDGSPNWQYVYLNISPEAKPGVMELQWKSGKQKLKRKYELRERREQRGAAGFSASDVLYMIMPDRFADGDPSIDHVASLRHDAPVDRSNPNVRHGGDLKGIMNNIDYIDSLGVTAVWLNPVLENDMPGGSYHGYATTDYYKIDPRFGSNNDYTLLIEQLHDRGIKTVMDMIFNHSGSAHPWVSEPPSSDWFNFQDDFRETNHKLSTISDIYASDYDRTQAQHGWFVREMPDLNQNNPHLMKYLIQNSIWWIEESQIDGIRMDTYPYADQHEMARWIDAVMDEYPGFNIVGECWFGETAVTQYWQKGSPVANAHGFDSHLPVVMDFPLMLKVRNLEPFTKRTDGWSGLSDIYGQMALDYAYANPMEVLRFLDNHDTERVIQKDIDNLDSWKQAITLLLTIPGIPQLYYGTELLMSGTREGGDGNVRKDMPGGFAGDTVNVFTREGRSSLQNEAFDYISAINAWRKNSKAIADPTMVHYAPSNGIYLYKRGVGDDAAVVVMNGRDEVNDVDMSRYSQVLQPGETLVDVITGEEVILYPSDNAAYTFKPRETRILVKKSN